MVFDTFDLAVFVDEVLIKIESGCFANLISWNRLRDALDDTPDVQAGTCSIRDSLVRKKNDIQSDSVEYLLENSYNLQS